MKNPSLYGGISDLSLHRDFIDRDGESHIILDTRQLKRSKSLAKLDNPAAISFRWPSGRQLFELSHRFALGCCFQPQFTAGFGFAVECLRDRCGSTHLTQDQHFDFEFAALVRYAQHVSGVNIARRFRRLPAQLNPSEGASFRRKRASLEKSCRPEPLVDSHGWLHGSHDLFSYMNGVSVSGD